MKKKTLISILLTLSLAAIACSINIDWGDETPVTATDTPVSEVPAVTDTPVAGPTDATTDIPSLPTATGTQAPTFTPFPTSTSTQMPSPTPILSYLIDTGYYYDSSAADNYELNSYYPMLNEVAYPGGAYFNSAVDALLQPIYTNFINAAAASDPGPIGGTSTQDISFEVKVSDNGYISILFTVSEYIAGAAHPNSVPKVINFDYIGQSLLLLNDIFSPGSDYLDRMSTYCKANVAAIEWPAGADPTATNYQYWNITPTGIMVSYDPYTVGPGAYGIVTCEVPYANLADIITIPFP